ncbi:hypothetical protein [Salinifilum ghardaiensis]
MRRALLPLVVVLLLAPAASAQAELPVLGPLFGGSEEESAPDGGAQNPSPGSGDAAPDPSEEPAPGKTPREEPPQGDPASEPPPERAPGGGGSPGKLPTGDSAGAAPGPGRTWTMTAEQLTLVGSRFHGTSQEQVAGRTVTTLHFTADRLEVTGLVQRSNLGNGRELRVASAPGAVSTVSGPVEMQVRELSGTLDVAGFPLVPVVLSAGALAPPDVDLSFLRLPALTFDDVTVRTVELSAAQLHVPDARTGLRPAG